MKKHPTKADIRTEIDRQVADFLNQGGEIEQVESGVSGRDSTSGAYRPIHQLFDQPKQPRTFLPGVVAAIDSRRKKPDKAKPVKKPQEKLKIIYDDFGEPIRKVWVEE